MIKEMTPLSLAEVKNIVDATEKEEDQDVKAFLKKFTKLNMKKAEELKKELVALEILKVKAENIVKIIDLLPEAASDLNKIFTEASLDENETSKLLEVIKKYR
jgi:DNA-directed RNA polymerase subunit F